MPFVIHYVYSSFIFNFLFHQFSKIIKGKNKCCVVKMLLKHKSCHSVFLNFPNVVNGRRFSHVKAFEIYQRTNMQKYAFTVMAQSVGIFVLYLL